MLLDARLVRVRPQSRNHSLKTKIRCCPNRKWNCVDCVVQYVFKICCCYCCLCPLQVTTNQQLLQHLYSLKELICDSLPVIESMQLSRKDSEIANRTALADIKYDVVLYKEQYQLVKALLPTVRNPRPCVPRKARFAPKSKCLCALSSALNTTRKNGAPSTKEALPLDRSLPQTKSLQAARDLNNLPSVRSKELVRNIFICCLKRPNI